MSRAGVVLFALACAGVCGCVESSTDVHDSGQAGAGTGSGASGGSGNFDRNAMLRNLADTVILPLYQDLELAGQELVDRCQDYALAAQAGAPDTAQRLADAQQAWRDASALWQRAELIGVGPAGSPQVFVGGENLRDEVYSYPSVDPCRVDQELVSQDYARPDFFQSELINVYGFDALEYLLFDTDSQNACGAGVSINQDGSWNTLVASGELERRRADYALVVAEGILGHLQRLVLRWSPAQGGFADALANAGQSGSPFFTAQQAANEIFFGMFYLDQVSKDLKLAVPAGLGGPGGPQPDQVESRFANASKEHLLANLRGFQRLFLGNGPTETARSGFDDFLTGVGDPALAQSMTQDIALAIAALEAINGTLQDAVTNEPVAVQTAFDAVKRLTDALKSQFVSVLNFALPAQGAGDND